MALLATPDSGNSDLFEDEERMGGLLKSLISAQGLNSAWQRVAKRLQTVELGLKKSQDTVSAFPKDYLLRDEFRKLVEEQHEVLLQKHTARLDQLEETVQKLLKTVNKEHDPKLQKCIESAEATESKRASLETMVISELKTLTGDVASLLAESRGTDAELKASLETRYQDVVGQIGEAVGQLQDFTHQEIARSQEALTQGEESSEGPSEQQMKMLEFISKHIGEPLKSELEESQAKHDLLTEEVAKQKEDFTREIRVAQKTAVDAGIRMKQVVGELKADLDMCSRRSEIHKIEGVMSTNITSVSSSMNTLQTKVTLKLNEFMDHFGKVHETIDDHEHCLRHHAEEIESRSTKYELLTCQHQLDRCALKDDFLRESAEVRKLLNWQTNKIESFGLLFAESKKKKKVVRRGPARIRRKASPGALPLEAEASQNSSRSSVGEAQLLGRSSLGEQRQGSLGSRTSVAIHGQPVATRISTNSPESDPIPEGTERRASISSSDDDEDETDEDGVSVAESDQTPNTSLVRQQLECLAMGLVSLGYLSLRETRIGQSRHARLLQERELLEELLNLRHWISSRMAPPGWDPKKLTTFALKCAHPREDGADVALPLAPHTLKGILSEAVEEMQQSKAEDGRPSPRRVPSADAALDRSAGAKTAPAVAVRPPVSARTLRGPHSPGRSTKGAGTTVLPPLTPQALGQAPSLSLSAVPLTPVAAA